MAAYFRFVLKHRLLVTLMIGALTALAAWSLSHAVLASSLQKMFFGESPAYDAYVERVHRFGTEEINVFAFETEGLLSGDELDRLERVTERLEGLPEVERAFSVLDTQRVEGDGTTLLVESYADAARDDPSRVEALLAEIEADPLAGGLVLSNDRRHGAIVVEIVLDDQRPAEALPQIRLDLLDAFAAEGFDVDALRTAGLLVTINETVSQTRYSITTIFPIVVLVLLITVWLLFRRFWPALMSSVVSLIAVIWTIGFAVALDPQINIMIAMAPTVIMIVGFSDVVHLCSAYLIELGDGRSKDEAILKSAEDVGRACFFTSATTFAGFVCLSFVPTPMFRVMGVVLGFGVGTALLVAMTLCPILFSVMREPKPLRAGVASVLQRWLDRLLARMEHVATAHPKAVIAVSGVVILAACAGVAGIRIEADFAKRLADDNQVAVDANWFDEHFTGTSGLDIFVETGEPGGLLDPERFAAITAYQAALVEEPEVDLAFSLVDLINDLWATYNPDRAEEEPIPPTRAALAQLLELFQNGDGQDLERLVDFNRADMRIMLRLNDDGVRGNSSLAARARVLGEEYLGADVHVEPSGLMFLLGDWLDEIIAGQRLGLLISLLMITLMMWWALGSARVAVVSMIPNLLPLLVMGGVLGGLFSYVDSDALAMALLAIGIGVDDTVHFLVRYRIESARTDRREALRRTFAFAGRAIVMTTVILCLGFAPFLLSDYYSTWLIGCLLPLALIVALVADLLLVPAMAQVGWLTFRSAASGE